MNKTPFLPQTYSPGSDIASGTKPNQIILGRTGNDLLLSYQPLDENISNDQIDVFLGSFELPELIDPVPREWSNKFILGDWRTPYYTNGNLFLFGLNNFALIADFNPTRDIIQLHGQSDNYHLLDLGIGTILIYEQEIFPGLSAPDVIAILPGSGFDLSDNYFQYVGNTPSETTNLKIKQVGTEGLEITDSITVDSLGNVYLAGTTTGSLISENLGLRDIWFKKYDSKGNLLLSEQFGTTETDAVFSIVTDDENNLYLVGNSQGDLSGPLEGIVADAWIAKYDSHGNQLWLEKITGSELGHPTGSYGVDIDEAGNIYVSGVVDVPTPPGSDFPLSTDNFIAKYDSDGNQLWFVQEGKPGILDFDESYGSTVDQWGNSYKVGFTTSDFAGTPAQLYDGWITKHDTDGNFEWIRQIATPDYDWAWTADTDSQGNVFVTGWTLGSLPGTDGNLGSYDAFLVKYDPQGNLEWTRQFGTSGDDEAFTLKIDELDNIYVAGYTDSAFEGFTNQGSFDAWVAMFDGLGNQVWVEQFGTEQTEQAYDIAVQNDSIYVTGITNGSLGTDNQGSFDSWVVKLKANKSHNSEKTKKGKTKYKDLTDTDNSSKVKLQANKYEVETQYFRGTPNSEKTKKGKTKYKDLTDTDNSTLGKSFQKSESEVSELAQLVQSGESALKIDELDNIYVANYRDSASEGFTNQSSSDTLIGKFGGLGRQVWGQQFGTAETEQANDIAVQNNSLHLTVLDLAQFGQSGEPVSNQPDILWLEEEYFVQLATDALAQALQISPDTLANADSLQSLLSDPTPYGEVQIGSLNGIDQLSTQI